MLLYMLIKKPITIVYELKWIYVRYSRKMSRIEDVLSIISDGLQVHFCAGRLSSSFLKVVRNDSLSFLYQYHYVYV